MRGDRGGARRTKPEPIHRETGQGGRSISHVRADGGGGAAAAPDTEETGDQGCEADEEGGLHGGRRRRRGEDRVLPGEGEREGDVQDQGREQVGHRGLERLGHSETEMGLRGAGVGEDD